MRFWLSLFLFPLFTLYAFSATTPKLIVAGWLPYWKVDDSAIDAVEHLNVLDEISPFAYYVDKNGILVDNFKDDMEPWSYVLDAAKAKKKKIIPSILWTDASQMYAVLSSKTKRANHIASIMKEMKKMKWDGIDIDYEGKNAETRVGFSSFLTELSAELKKINKKLVCTIEARTPIDSRYATVTPELLSRIEYANDYKVIGKVCDSVRLMTYDQIDGDVKLNTAYTSTLYRPVSDIDWVEKVLTLTLDTIPAKKLFVGVATYGYKYEITPKVGTTTQQYKRIGSMNFQYADELAKQLKITPTRHSSGEAYFTYSTTTDLNGKPYGMRKDFLVWYSDAKAIGDKVQLAKLYKLAGVAIFKVDGAEDQDIWKLFGTTK